MRRPALISVVVPIRNGERYVAHQLAALSAQTYTGAWELVAVDNGCQDRSIEIVESFRDRLPSVQIVSAPRRGLGRARNAGARAARGELLAYCDADDVAAPEWLEALADGAALADIVMGSFDFETLNSDLQLAWEPTEPTPSLQSGYGFMPYASGGNCAIWARVTQEIGWDESFAFGASDIEFGWRAQLAGFRIALVPGAVMRLRFRARPLAVAKQHFRYGMSEPYLFRRFRGRGMPRDLRRGLQTWGWLWRNSPHVLRSREAQGNWLRLAGKSFGRIYGSLRWRVLFL